MRICPIIQDQTIGSGPPIPAYKIPAVVRVKARDAALALGIPTEGRWGPRVRREMVRRGWQPLCFRHDGASCSGYERVISE